MTTTASLTRGDHVRVLLPGRFNPNVPGNREPDAYVVGVLEGRTPGIPITWHVRLANGRRIAVADGNVWKRGECSTS